MSLHGARWGRIGFGFCLGEALRGEGLAKALTSPGEQGPSGDMADAERRRQLDACQVVELGRASCRERVFSSV